MFVQIRPREELLLTDFTLKRPHTTHSWAAMILQVALVRSTIFTLVTGKSFFAGVTVLVVSKDIIPECATIVKGCTLVLLSNGFHFSGMYYKCVPLQLV